MSLMNFKNLSKRHKAAVILEWILLVLVVSGLAITLYYLVRDYAILSYRGQTMSLHRPRRGLRGMLFVPRQKLQPADIQGWMTFHFLNRVFNMPENYLQQQLSMSDKRYPNISLDDYVNSKRLNEAKFIAQVQSLVANYQKNQPAGSGSAP